MCVAYQKYVLQKKRKRGGGASVVLFVALLLTLFALHAGPGRERSRRLQRLGSKKPLCDLVDARAPLRSAIAGCQLPHVQPDRAGGNASGRPRVAATPSDRATPAGQHGSICGFAVAAAAELVERGLARRPVGLRQHGAGVAVPRVFPRCHIHCGVLQQNTV